MAAATGIARGAAAGSLSTVSMSAVMWGAQQLGLMGQQPPKKITRAALEAVDATPLPEPAENAMSLLAHLGFGAACGAAFTAARRVAPARIAVPAVVQGMAF